MAKLNKQEAFAIGFAIVHYALVIVCGVPELLDRIVDGPIWQRLARGFLIGSYVAFGKELAKLASCCAIRKQMPVFSQSPDVNRFIVGGFIVLAILAVVAWEHTWEGPTGVCFGIGVFLAVSLTDYGFAKVLLRYCPPREGESSGVS